VLPSRELAGNTATTDPRSQRIRASRRGGQITARARSPSFQRRPARTHVLPVPRVPDGLTIALVRRSAEREGTEAIMPDNGMVERFNSRVQREVLGITIYSHQDLEVLLAGCCSQDGRSRRSGPSAQRCCRCQGGLTARQLTLRSPAPLVQSRRNERDRGMENEESRPLRAAFS
jgi:hypothetical protein